MYAPRWGMGYFFWLALIFYLMATAEGAIGPGGVLVLYNNDSSEGIEIANHYAQVHPGVQLLGLDLEGYNTNDEQISGAYYLNVIRPQILPALNSSIDVIVTTKGLPLRIYSDISRPDTYTDPFGVLRTTNSAWWKPYSSLESELTRIDTIGAGYNPNNPSTLTTALYQMNDQFYFDTAGDPNRPQPSENPYYPYDPYPLPKTIGPFDYSTYYIDGYGGMRLTARLDGFTTANVKASIDRAQKAYLMSTSRWVVLDDDPNSVGGDRINYLKTVLNSKTQAYNYNNTDAAITTASGPVIGYVSHGTNDGTGGLTSGYIAGQLIFTTTNGAIFQTHESFNAISFQQGENWINPGTGEAQGLVAEWLAIGGTAGVGHVYEPMSGRDYEANEDQVYKMLLNGYTWAEAAWSSTQQLSYVNTVVGDPLMVWKQVIPGDANLDGLVGSADLALLGANWGTKGQTGGYRWGQGDFNADGLVGSSDLALLGANWGQKASWASGGALTAGPLDMEAFLAGIPEPSTMTLILASLLTLLAGYGWRQLRFTPLALLGSLKIP